MAIPKLNTLEKDIEDFQKERQKFLEDQERFKAGYVTFGIVALNHLASMYYILLASYHYPLKEKSTISPSKYLAAIQALKQKIAQFVKANQDAPTDQIGVNLYQHPKFKDIENEFDAVVQDFYIIKSECGLT